MRDHSDQRLANPRCALLALRIKQDEPELRLVHQLLDNWNGIGLISVGMRRQGMSLTHVAGRHPIPAPVTWVPRQASRRGG